MTVKPRALRRPRQWQEMICIYYVILYERHGGDNYGNEVWVWVCLIMQILWNFITLDWSVKEGNGPQIFGSAHISH